VVRASHPEEFACGEEVKKLLEDRFAWDLNQNELLYLTLHIARLTQPLG
jgi:beta-glucoside operon transcriptional antiterminator